MPRTRQSDRVIKRRGSFAGMKRRERFDGVFRRHRPGGETGARSGPPPRERSERGKRVRITHTACAQRIRPYAWIKRGVRNQASAGQMTRRRCAVRGVGGLLPDRLSVAVMTNYDLPSSALMCFRPRVLILAARRMSRSESWRSCETVVTPNQISRAFRVRVGKSVSTSKMSASRLFTRRNIL